MLVTTNTTCVHVVQCESHRAVKRSLTRPAVDYQMQGTFHSAIVKHQTIYFLVKNISKHFAKTLKTMNIILRANYLE